MQTMSADNKKPPIKTPLKQISVPLRIYDAFGVFTLRPFADSRRWSMLPLLLKTNARLPFRDTKMTGLV